MHRWTPALRARLIEIIRARPGIKQVDLAKQVSKGSLTYPCDCNAGMMVAEGKGAWSTCLPGTPHILSREWRVSDIYPHLSRMRARGEIYSAYQPVEVTFANGRKVQTNHFERAQSWYYGPRLPDLTDPDAVQRWLDDVPPEPVGTISVDDEGFPQPALDGLPV